MTPDVDALVARFVRACLEVFGEQGVEGIVLHGSVVKGGSIEGFSDVDFMVFLTPDAFDPEGNLPDDMAFAMQERIGPLPWREAGILYPQAYFYDARRLPDWWSGPAAGSFRVLLGRLPDEAAPTAERLRASAARYLRDELSKRITSSVQNFADGDDASLSRRVRLLGTDVTPAVFSLVTPASDDPLELWALHKFEALARLEALYPGNDGPALGRRFYEQVGALYGHEPFDAELARQAFRTGVAFLRWAEKVAKT
ncbi:MAG: nucleotidyltransferase domain-containing protein [Dehalococcoidia bacterium]